MTTMYANQYAQHKGYPLTTIKKFCKAGIIPCERIGRKYLINVELADQVLLERLQAPKIDMKPEAKKPILEHDKNFDLLAGLNNLLNKKEEEKCLH